MCGGKGRRWPVECHEVKHFGRAQTVGRGDAALAHLMQVNRWTEDQAWEHIEESFAVWERRSGIVWSLDLNWLDKPAPVDFTFSDGKTVPQDKY